MAVGLGFLIIGGVFVFSLLGSIMGLLNMGWDEKHINAKSLLNHFKVPLLSFVALIIFIAWIIPLLEGNG